jgi:hypothetical protein
LESGAFETLSLEHSRSLDPLPHSGAGFTRALAAQLLEGHTGHVDVDVDPTGSPAGDRRYVRLRVIFDGTGQAGAFFLGVAVIAARAGVQTKVAF